MYKINEIGIDTIVIAQSYYKEKKEINSVKNDNIQIYKPVPSPIDKIKNKYRWRIIMKCKVTSKVLDIINPSLYDKLLECKKLKDVKVN